MLAEKLRSAAQSINNWNTTSIAMLNELSAGTLTREIDIRLNPTTNPTNLWFKPDGSRLFIVDSTTNDVTQHDLSLPWRISTASASAGLYDVTAQTASPETVALSTDGTKLYVGSTSEIYQYTLATAWDVTTASYSGLLYNPAQAGNIQGLTFSPDGTKMYTTTSSSFAYQYTLSTAWDVSTASYASKSIDASALFSSYVSGISFTSDGNFVFLVGTLQPGFALYSLGTAYDISTATYLATLYAGLGNSSPRGVFVGFNDTMLYTGDALDDIRQLIMGFELFAVPDLSAPSGAFISPDGLKFYAIDYINGDSIKQFSFANPWDIYSLSYDSKDFSVAGQLGGARNMTFKPDGTNMYITGDIPVSGNVSVYQYTLSTAWDISTASYVRALDVSVQETLPVTPMFDPTGTKLFVFGTDNDDIHEYLLPTAWNLTGGTFVQTKTGPARSVDATFSSNGRYIYWLVYMTTDDTYELRRQPLAAEWDISSAQTIDIITPITEFVASLSRSMLMFKTGGGSFYMVSNDTDSRLFQFDLL